MNNIHKINKNMLKSYPDMSYRKDKVLEDLDKIKAKKESEPSIGSQIALDVFKYGIEKGFGKVGEKLLDKVESVVAKGNCFVSGTTFIISDTMSEVLKLCKIEGDYVNKINVLKKSSNEKFEENFIQLKFKIKIADIDIINIPYGKLLMYGTPFALSKLIYMLETKAGKEHSISNIYDCCKYERLIKKCAIDEVSSIFVPTYLDSISNIVTDKIFPYFEEVYDYREDDTTSLCIESQYKKNVNQGHVGINVSIETLEKAITQLKSYKLRQIEMFNILNISYTRFRESDNRVYPEIENTLKLVNKNIRITFNECDRAIAVLNNKRELFNDYLDI